MPGGCLEAKPASVPFVLSENRARRGSDLPINPEPEPSAELRGEERAGGALRGRRAQHLAEGGICGEPVGAQGARGVGLGHPLHNQ